MVPYHRRNQLSHFAELTDGSRLYVVSPLQGIGGTAQPVLIQAGKHLSTKRKETYRYAFMQKPFYHLKALFY